VLGPVGRVLPALGRRQDDLLVVERGGGRGRDDADAVGQEGRVEVDGWVEGLPDEEVAVVEGGGEDGDLDFVG
jgi:hypothetical protein